MAFPELSSELFHVDAVFGRFARANEDYGNVQPITLFENRIPFDVHFAKHSAAFAQQWCYGRLGFFAEVAARPRIQGDFARARGSQPPILLMPLHGFGFEYF